MTLVHVLSVAGYLALVGGYLIAARFPGLHAYG